MNHIFRVIWNEAHNCWQAVAEFVKGHCAPGSKTPRGLRRAYEFIMAGFGKKRLYPRFSLTLGAFLVNSAFAAPPAPNQLPVGGQVAQGQVAISQSGANMQITQGSQQAVVNWQGFNIGSNAAVNISQPNSQAAILNRVNSADPTQIHGKLTANGQVFIVNSNGVLFGPGAKVDVGGLVAGAMKITDTDFMAGNYKFTQGQGSVVNQGELTAKEGGLIALLAPEVRNEGIIRAKLGTIVLAAGEEITLTNAASGITVVINKGSLNALIENRQLVSSEDGSVFMSARAATALQRAVINNTGTIEAKGARLVGGVIRLEANTVKNTGQLDASIIPTTANAQGAQGKGGQVTVSADEFINTGSVKANGANGGKGGEITVNATQSITNAGTLEANGSGGLVTLNTAGWFSQEATGIISAQMLAQTQQDIAAVAGRILLQAQQAQINGMLNANSSTGSGGLIDISGGSLVLLGAFLNASGDTNGGSIKLRVPAPPVAPAPTAPTSPAPFAPAAPGSLNVNNSNLSTSSRRGKAGDIELTGDDLSLSNNTKLDATGAPRGR